MSFFETDSWRLPLAVLEIVLLLCGSAAVGWLIVKLSMDSRIDALNELIFNRKIELASCRTDLSDLQTNTLRNSVRETPFTTESISIPPDDLKIIQGIGPKIEEMLNKEGICTFANLAATSPVYLSIILKKAGPRFQIQDTTSWPEQAGLAQSAKWEELAILKTSLISGRTNVQ